MILNKAKFKSFIYVVLLALYFSLPAAARNKGTKVSESIRTEYESLLFTLKPDLQKHYSVRMYRLTGDKRYIYPIIYDFLITIKKLERYSDNISDTLYIKKQAELLLDEFNEGTRKGSSRRELFKDKDSTLFFLDLLYNTNKLIDYHLVGIYKNIFDIIMSQLKQFNFATFLLDQATITDYAPQAVNYVYYLNDLRIVDIRSEYKSAFQKDFPDSLDAGLSDEAFMDKIYGLTHFITAASGYYQHFVDSLEFSWISDYFDNNIDRITQTTKPDIIAEVGICFRLCNYKRSKPIEKCINAIIKAYDKSSRMILSTGNSADSAKGEHRNVLAIMLLNWPDTLYSGPYLNNFTEFKEVIGN